MLPVLHVNFKIRWFTRVNLARAMMVMSYVLAISATHKVQLYDSPIETFHLPMSPFVARRIWSIDGI